MSPGEADAPIALRARGDLVARPQTFRGRRHWCVKDPVSLSYFHLSDLEYSLLRRLDGRATLGSLERAVERESGAPAGAEQIGTFLGSLARNGLAVAEAAGGGAALWRRRVAARRSRARNFFPALLSLRFRGVDPSRLLRRLEAAFGWAFSAWCLVAAAAFVAAAVLFAAGHADEFAATLPAAGAYLTAGNVVVLTLTIGGVKVLHELGHALACRRLGGECPEIGFMLLVFAPCLYCDVSDSWMFGRKRDRIAVAAAGIGVELFLAAAATFGWWFSEPGLFHTVCMNVMLVCSLNTLLLNGNPLLRYDGYFVLSDWLEIPNLAAESRAALSRLAFGRGPGDPGLTDDPEPILLTYGVLSAVYRVSLTWAIALAAIRFLTPVGLAPVGYLFATACMLSVAAGPVAAVRAAAASPRRRRALVAVACAAAAVAALALIPLPRRVGAAAVLQPRGAHRVYATVGGRLVEAVAPGTAVRSGDTIGRLSDADLEREVAGLEGRVAELTARLESLERRRLADAAAAARLASAREALEGATAQLEARRRDREALTLRAPAAGVVLPPPDRPAGRVQGEPPEWSGSPLEPRNLGCVLEPGTLYCLVGRPGLVEATLCVGEDEIGAVRPGQPVRLRLSQAAGRTLAGRVEAVASDPLTALPPELARAGVLPAKAGEDGVLRPVETVYEIRVRLGEETDGETLRVRGTGRATVAVAPTTGFERLRRFLGRTFRFDL
jgi:putative peptide zinc metalloprotease protein